MKVTILGGAGEYGRSCFLLQINNYNLLIDCGVLKSGKTVEEQYPALTSELARKIDAVFITHAHEDHTGSLPYLVSLGYKGNVYATEETIFQTAYYLKVWRQTQLDRIGTLPYSKEDEEQINFRPIKEWKQHPLPGLSVDYGKNGHLLGSLWYLFSNGETSAYFSGDFTMESGILSFSYPKPKHPISIAVMDGAYGIESQGQHIFKKKIIETVQRAVDNKTSIIFPLPPFGRSQDILYLLRKFLKDDLFSIRMDPIILAASKHYLENSTWFKSGVYEEFQQVVEYISIEQAKLGENKPLLALYTERALLEEARWTEEESLQFIFTGPGSQQLKEKIRDHYGKNSIEEIRYKVHPAVSEIEKLLHVLQPQQTILTHSTKEDTLPLAEELKKRTGLLVDGGEIKEVMR